MYYLKSKHTLIGFQRAKNKKKKYDAIIERDGKQYRIPFGDAKYEQFRDLTGLNLYKSHGDIQRKKNYRSRHKRHLRAGYYSAGYFSYYYLWR